MWYEIKHEHNLLYVESKLQKKKKKLLYEKMCTHLFSIVIIENVSQPGRLMNNAIYGLWLIWQEFVGFGMFFLIWGVVGSRSNVNICSLYVQFIVMVTAKCIATRWCFYVPGHVRTNHAYVSLRFYIILELWSPLYKRID